MTAERAGPTTDFAPYAGVYGVHGVIMDEEGYTEHMEIVYRTELTGVFDSGGIGFVQTGTEGKCQLGRVEGTSQD